MTDAALDSTRRALHAVAELVLAGPQHRQSGTIRLRVTQHGFGTVAAPRLDVVGTELVTDSHAVPIDGQTPRALAASVGVQVGAPAEVYGDGSGASPDDPVAVDVDAVRLLFGAYAIGDEALRLLAPDVEPVLWPEHFDVGIRIGEVNFGVSPGDGHFDRPYAYIGLASVPDDPYWNAPFGRMGAIADFDDAAGLRDFFVEGRDRHAAAPAVT